MRNGCAPRCAPGQDAEPLRMLRLARYPLLLGAAPQSNPLRFGAPRLGVAVGPLHPRGATVYGPLYKRGATVLCSARLSRLCAHSLLLPFLPPASLHSREAVLHGPCVPYTTGPPYMARPPVSLGSLLRSPHVPTGFKWPACCCVGRDQGRCGQVGGGRCVEVGKRLTASIHSGRWEAAFAARVAGLRRLEMRAVRRALWARAWCAAAAACSSLAAFAGNHMTMPSCGR